MNTLKPRILFAGHDLKFLSYVIAHFKTAGFPSEIVTYSTHRIPNPERIMAVLPDIDIVFCEWGLGNLAWISRNKIPGQTLIARIHSQEFYTTFLAETEWRNVDRIIFVSRHMRDKFVRMFPENSEKCSVIHNLIDCDTFDLAKQEDARFHLGMLGVLPKLKAPHLGLQLLRELKNRDARYKLYLKGKKPEEYEWLSKRTEETAYYQEFWETVWNSELRDDIVWEPYGNDVPAWFSKIGFILSCSERESFHMSPAEGMASRAIPVIRNWEGARELYPERFIFNDVPEAVRLIEKYSDINRFQAEGLLARKYSQDRFDKKVILPEYDRIMNNEWDISELRREFQKMKEKIDAYEREGLAEQQRFHRESHDRALDEILRLKGELDSSRAFNIDLKNDFDDLRRKLEESERRFSEMRNSLPWKFGNAVIGKPLSLIRGSKRKGRSRKASGK